MGRAAGAVLLALALLLCARSACAETLAHPPVSLHIASCLGTSHAEIRRIVELELRAKLVGDGAENRDATRVTLDCHNPHVILEIQDPVTGKALRRSYNLTAVAKVAHSRALALAIVELLSASWSELEVNETPVMRPVELSATEPARDAARALVRSRAAQRPAFRCLGSAALQTGRALPALWGGGARVVLDLTLPLSFSLDASYATNDSESPLGGVDISVASTALGVAWHQALGDFDLYSGLFTRVGTASFRGTPFEPARALGSTVSGTFGASGVSVMLMLSPSRSFLVALGGELGTVLSPVQGDVEGGREIAVAGAWFGATASLGFRL